MDKEEIPSSWEISLYDFQTDASREGKIHLKRFGTNVREFKISITS